jgi:hypothetical protein
MEGPGSIPDRRPHFATPFGRQEIFTLLVPLAPAFR